MQVLISAALASRP